MKRVILIVVALFALYANVSAQLAGIKKTLKTNFKVFGLGERIRTSGLLNPIQARYQTALHPDIS